MKIAIIVIAALVFLGFLAYLLTRKEPDTSGGSTLPPPKQGPTP